MVINIISFPRCVGGREGGREGGAPYGAKGTLSILLPNLLLTSDDGDIEIIRLRSMDGSLTRCQTHTCFPFTRFTRTDSPPVRGAVGAAAGLQHPGLRPRGIYILGRRTTGVSTRVGSCLEVSQRQACVRSDIGALGHLQGLMKLHTFLKNLPKDDILTIINEDPSFFPS